MINASEKTKALETILNNGLADNYTVERSEYINMDQARTPWVGIYRGTLTYDTATLGRGANNWKAQFDIRLIVQAATYESGEVAEELLEEYIKEVLDLVVADKTFSSTIGMVTGIDINYSYNEVESESLYFQNAEITVTTEVRTA